MGGDQFMGVEPSSMRLVLIKGTQNNYLSLPLMGTGGREILGRKGGGVPGESLTLKPKSLKPQPKVRTYFPVFLLKYCLSQSHPRPLPASSCAYKSPTLSQQKEEKQLDIEDYGWISETA